MEVWIIRQDFTDLISSKSKGLNDSSSQVHIVMCYIYILYINVSIFVFWNRLTAQDFGSIYFRTWGQTQVPVSGVLPFCSFEGFPNLELISYNWYNQVSYLTPSVYLYWQKPVYTTLHFTQLIWLNILKSVWVFSLWYSFLEIPVMVPEFRFFFKFR